MRENVPFSSVSSEGSQHPPDLACDPNRGDLALLASSARSYVDDARANSTQRAYRTSWNLWVSWCATRGLVSLPTAPESLALYMADLADRGRKVATISRALVAISQAHRMAGHPSPRSSELVRSVLKGIRRRLGVAPRQKAALLPEQLTAIAASLPSTLRGARDRALLLLGFVGACRRSELVALDVRDAEFSGDGLTLIVRRSKTDQEGMGRRVGVPCGTHRETCPVRSLRVWLDLAKITSGAIFRGVNRHGQVGERRLDGGSVARIVQRSVAAIGQLPSEFGGHSLRAGLATAAARAGKSERSIMAQTGHRSVTMVRRYIRDGDLFRDNAAAGIGL